MTMVAEIPYAVMITLAVIFGLYIANVFYDKGIEQYQSRKIGHLAGGVGFLLLPLLFSTFWWPIIITIGFTILLLYAHLARPTAFRGVGGSGRPHALAEIHFPATGIVLIAVLWGRFNQPWLAIVPCLFMAFGDSVTAFIRMRIYGREMKGNIGSFGMLAVCLLLAYFIHPYWIGATGAAVATLAERFTKTSTYIDDNFTIPLISGLVMGVLFACFGYL